MMKHLITGIVTLNYFYERLKIYNTQVLNESMRRTCLIYLSPACDCPLTPGVGNNCITFSQLYHGHGMNRFRILKLRPQYSPVAGSLRVITVLNIICTS